MAGGGGDDNPLPINVVPMVDVIFCLCVFFMCSFKFKETEGKFDQWLPRDKGQGGEPDPGDITEMRVAMFYDENTQKTKRLFGVRTIQSDEEIQELLKGAHEDNLRRNKPTVPLIIDAAYGVPWKEVMLVVNIGKRLDISNIEFALGVADKPQ